LPFSDAEPLHGLVAVYARMGPRESTRIAGQRCREQYLVHRELLHRPVAAGDGTQSDSIRVWCSHAGGRCQGFREA